MIQLSQPPVKELQLLPAVLQKVEEKEWRVGDLLQALLRYCERLGPSADPVNRRACSRATTDCSLYGGNEKAGAEDGAELPSVELSAERGFILVAFSTLHVHCANDLSGFTAAFSLNPVQYKGLLHYLRQQCQNMK
ncbi:hypothetical protein GJAV_G00097710 [Gymnothorax javanicus]|nr:hypothetical protein GJAV_G00097710 [Gymnothorax javanicus]